jgi:hypothetical protein
MRWVAAILSLLVVALGAIGLVSPAALLGVAGSFVSPSGLRVAAALRIVLGGTLFLAAPTSRVPRVLRVLGVLILVAGLITPFIGPERARAALDAWTAGGLGVVRAGAAFALAFGAFLVWALLPAPGSGRTPA